MRHLENYFQSSKINHQKKYCGSKCLNKSEGFKDLAMGSTLTCGTIITITHLDQYISNTGKRNRVEKITVLLKLLHKERKTRRQIRHESI